MLLRPLLVPWLVLSTACYSPAPAVDPTDGSAVASDAANGVPTFVHRDGIKLVDGAGDPLVLKGVNLGGWLLWEGWIWGGEVLGGLKNSETQVFARLVDLLGADAASHFREQIRDTFITEADISRVAALGLDSVRVPFNHSLLESDEMPFVYSESGFARLDHVIDWGTQHHVYVVLDLHSTPNGQCNTFTEDPDAQLVWSSAMAQDRTVALWKAIAARYRDRAWVAGYDLLNEPCQATDEQLRALSARIIAAIREVDPNHLVIVEGNAFATVFTGFPARLDENQAYSFHTYNFLGDDRAQKFPIYAALAADQQVPLWVGEFGQATKDYVSSTVQMFKDPQYNVTGGWASWTWKRAPSDKPVPEAISIPTAWSKTIKWITAPSFNAMATPAEAAAGAEQLVAAVALDRCTEDMSFVDVLK